MMKFNLNNKWYVEDTGNKKQKANIMNQISYTGIVFSKY